MIAGADKNDLYIGIFSGIEQGMLNIDMINRFA
jgi:hypothetical protein